MWQILIGSTGGRELMSDFWGQTERLATQGRVDVVVPLRRQFGVRIPSGDTNFSLTVINLLIEPTYIIEGDLPYSNSILFKGQSYIK